MYRDAMEQISSLKTKFIGEKAFIFGGAYGNLQATEAILNKAAELDYKKSEIIFTGDMVAYCADPLKTSKLIEKSVDHIIMGNCEEAISQGANDCGCGFEKGSQCSVLSNQWYNYCLSKIDSETAEWMGKLPRCLSVKIGNYTFLVTHASPSSTNQFIFPSNMSEDYSSNDKDGYIVGHSGIPFIKKTYNKIWLNSGSSGMPANDGTDNIWYATIEIINGELVIETHPLEYDFNQAKNAMLKAGLNNGYMECLETGLWPSLDILPEVEKEQTGIQIQPQRLIYQRHKVHSLQTA